MSLNEHFHVDTHPGFEETPDLIGLGIKSLARQAVRLGITWRLRLATVIEALNANQLNVLLDGDTVPITVMSMMGSLSAGQRVYVLSIPPAGNYVVGGVTWTFPGQRIATTIRTTNSAGFTAETVVDSVTGTLIGGRTYRVRVSNRIQSSVADGYARGRIREDSLTGTQLSIGQMATTIAANQSAIVEFEVEYTPTTNEVKTFVMTYNRQAGTGTLTATAATDTPVYFYIEYVRG